MFKVTGNLGKYLTWALIGLLAGTLLFILQPTQWRGQALIRIGQIQSGVLIEPLPTVIERLKTNSFVTAVGERAGIDGVTALLNVEEGASITIRTVKNSDTLIITVDGGSLEIVRAAMDGIVAELIYKHSAIINAYQRDVKKELARIEDEYSLIIKQIGTVTGAANLISSKVLDANRVAEALAVLSLRHELEQINNRASLLHESISSLNIRQTTLVEPISVSVRRIFSANWRASLLGMLLGVFFCAIWIRFRK